jgi:hypothetical protein
MASAWLESAVIEQSKFGLKGVRRNRSDFRHALSGLLLLQLSRTISERRFAFA